MIDEKKLPADVQTKYYKWTNIAGFGLWWLCLGAAALIPEAEMSNSARMYLVIGAAAYAVVIIGGLFFSGYSKAVRHIANLDRESRKLSRENLLYSIIGTALCFFVIKLIDDYLWYEALLAAAFFSFTVGLWLYIAYVRKPKAPRS